MRISTSWSQQLGINAMNAQQVKMSKTQMQLSSGLNITTPSEDPASAVSILSLEESIEKSRQYQSNIAITRSRLNIEEGALATAETVLFRAKELTVQALNAPLTTKDFQAVKSEIDQMLKQMVGISNTQNANGEYVFSGDLSQTPSVAWDTDTNSYVYQGGVNQRALDIAPERRVADGDLGLNVFFDIDSVSQHADRTVNSNEINTRSVFDTLQALSQALSGHYEVPEATLTGDRFMRYGVDYSSGGTLGATSFTLTGDDGAGGTAAVNISLPAVATDVYESLDEVVTAINLQLSGSNMEARSNGNKIEFVSLTKGLDSNIQITAGTGSFLTDFGFTTGDAAVGSNITASIVGTQSIPFPSPVPLPKSLAYAGTVTQFELNDEVGNATQIVLNADYADFNALNSAIQAQITGSALDGKVEVVTGSNPIEFRSISSGDKASVQIKQIQGDFLRNAGFNSGDTGRIFNQTANDVLTDIDTALDNFLKIRTTVGARMRALDEQESQNEKFVLDMQTILSDIKDLDYAEAIGRFNVEQTALQAAQQAYSRVQNLSLFNFL